MAQIDETKDKEKTEKVNEQTPAEPAKSVTDLEAEIARLKAENEKQRTSISRASSDAADWKRKYTATLDEAKQKELALEEQRKRELEELELLRSERRVSNYREKLMDAGIDRDTADLMAKALPDGVGEEYFTAYKAFSESQRQAQQAAALKNQPGLSVGMPPTAADAQREDLNRLRKSFGLPPLK